MNISIESMLSWVQMLYDFLWNSVGTILTIMFTSLNDLMNTDIPLALLEWPIAGIVLGAGFIAYITVTLVKFFI